MAKLHDWRPHGTLQQEPEEKTGDESDDPDTGAAEEE